MNLPHMAPGVKYPQNAFSLNLASLEFVDAVKMPDYDGYGYDDDYTHLERWLPLEEVGTMPRYDVLGEPSDETNEDVNNDNYHYALGSLTSRERTILMQYYTAKEDGTVATLREIGQEFNLSYERIRQIISSAIEKVRKEYALLQKARIDREIATNLLKTTSNSKLAGLKTQNPLKDITTPEQRALINRAKLNGLAQAKLATGRMTVNGTGVVVPIED